MADYPALAADHRDLYKIVLPAGQSYLKITNSVTGTGDCDYYLKPGTPPTTRDYYAKDDRIGNDVNIEVKNPTPGTWYLMLYAKTDFIGQTYQADWAADTYPQPPFVTANLTDPLDKVKISWPAVAGATDYAIYRSDVNSTEYASQLAVCDIGTDPVIYYDEFNGVNFHYYWVKTNKGPDESAFSNVASIAKTDLATQKILTNGKAVSGLTGKGGYTYKYVFTVQGGQNLLEIRTFGGTGNCDLTVERFGDATFNGYSVNEGNNESIIINDPAGDTYYIYLYGKTDFSKVTLFAKYYNTAPIPPTGVMASDGTFENKVVVNWKASPGAASYLIYRNTTNDSGNAKFLAEIPDTTYQDLSVASDTYATYYYWVKAKNTKGTSAISSKGDSGYPTRYAAPTATVTASDGTYFDKVRITWASVPGATSYEISRNTSETLIGSTLCSTVAFNNTKKTYTYDVTGDNLTSSIGPWYFFVQPKNANGFSTAKHDQGSLNLAGPAGVKATDGTLYKRTKITWTAVPGAAHYYVYRTTDNTLDNVEKGFGPIQPPLTECYDDTPDMDGTPHYYWVQAADAGENYFSDYSLCDVGWSKTDFTTLPAPSLKSVSNGIEDKVTVTWGEVAAANKYELWRADVPSTTGAGLTQIGSSLSSTTLSAEDTSGTDWVTYYYFVKSTNSTLGLPAGVSSIKPGMKTSKINDIPADTDALTGGLDSRTLYKFDVIPGVSRFVINLTGTGCELYTKFGSAPSRKSFYAKGTVTSPTSQIISIANPSGGTWYILLYGTAVYSDVYMDTYQTSPQQINITAEPLNGFTAPFTAVFKGTITDGSNNAVPNIDFTVRDPQTGLLTWLKSDKKGYWTYSPVIRTEGVHTFDFYLGGATDIQRTSYSVYTLKQAYEPSKQYFDYAGYFRASYSLQTSDDLVKAQWLEFLDIRNGYVTGKTPDGTYTYNWYNESGYNSITDQNLAAKLKSGLYIAYYGFEGAGFGITPFPGYSELKFTPLLVRISEAKLDEVLPKAIGLKLIDENQKGVVDNGGICVITLTPYSNPNEGGPSTFKLKLTAKQQFELLTNLLSGDSAFVSEAKNDFDENILQRLYDVKLDNGYRTIRLMNFTFTK